MTNKYNDQEPQSEKEMKNKIILFAFLGIIWGIVSLVEFAENGSIRTADVIRMVGVGAVLLFIIQSWRQRKTR